MAGAFITAKTSKRPAPIIVGLVRRGRSSYSFTLTNYAVGSNDAVQCQIFLVPNPGTESDPDWTEPNVIFLDLESDTPNGGGATGTFATKPTKGQGIP